MKIIPESITTLLSWSKENLVAHNDKRDMSHQIAYSPKGRSARTLGKL